MPMGIATVCQQLSGSNPDRLDLDTRMRCGWAGSELPVTMHFGHHQSRLITRSFCTPCAGPLDLQAPHWGEASSAHVYARDQLRGLLPAALQAPLITTFMLQHVLHQRRAALLAAAPGSNADWPPVATLQRTDSRGSAASMCQGRSATTSAKEHAAKTDLEAVAAVLVRREEHACGARSCNVRRMCSTCACSSLLLLGCTCAHVPSPRKPGPSTHRTWDCPILPPPQQ